MTRPHCKNCSILQVCIVKHQTDQALPNRECCTTFCPGLCYFKAGLLQYSFDLTSIIHNQTSTNDSECSGTIGLQWAQKAPWYTSLHLPALATICSSHQTLCLHIEQLQAQHYLHSLLLIYIPSTSLRSMWATPHGTFTERHNILEKQVPDWWNDLPITIWNVESLTIFKRQLKTHLHRQHSTSS